MILGRGHRGIVYRGSFENQFVAVKRMNVANLEDNNEEDVLQKLNHDNIIKFYHAEYQNDNQFRYRCRIILALPKITLLNESIKIKVRA